MPLNQHRCWVAYGEAEMHEATINLDAVSALLEPVARAIGRCVSAHSRRRAREELRGNGRSVISTA